ncbi:MAG TPA: MFS transporter [Acidimicrobiia bacterium]|nr:MFS transporter [Acidimicrobiia bacterium]
MSDLDNLQRRSLSTLMVGQALATGAQVSMAATVGLLSASILGSDRLAGLPTAIGTLGTALLASPLAIRASRKGRRPALWTGYLLGGVGGMLAAFAGQVGNLGFLLLGMVLFGGGQAASLQTRFAATDLAAPDRRARAIALVVWVGAIGGVLGPVLTPFLERSGRSLALGPWVAPILGSGLLFFAAAGWSALRLRPDPLLVRGERSGVIDPVRRDRRQMRTAIAAVRTSPRAQLALGMVTLSQAAMVAVMTMTPLHMRDHGQADLAGLVIAAHVFGMFGLAPLVGRYADRRGNLQAGRDGGVILAVGIVLSVVAGYQPVLIFVGLFLLGLGWNFGLIAGSALLVDSVGDEARVGAQGLTDTLLSVLGAGAAVLSGLVKQGLGFHWLANLATAGAMIIVVWAVMEHRRALSEAMKPA